MTPCPYRFAQGWHCCMLAGHSGEHVPAAADFLTPPAPPQAIAAAGYAAVFLYYKMPTFAGHAQAHLAAGLGVIPTFETTADRALSGASGGESDGAACAAQSRSVAQASGTAVAFNIADFKPASAQMPALYAYLQAFDAALGALAPAPYLTRFALDALVELGASPSLGWWQNAMSDGNETGDVVDANAAFLQRVAPVLSIPGAAPGSWDEDVILRPVPVWGMKTPTPSPAPSPAPAPSPSPSPSPSPIARPGGNGMLVVRTASEGAAYLVSGGKLAPLYDEATVLALEAAGVGVAEIASRTDFGKLITAFGG